MNLKRKHVKHESATSHTNDHPTYKTLISMESSILYSMHLTWYGEGATSGLEERSARGASIILAYTPTTSTSVISYYYWFSPNNDDDMKYTKCSRKSHIRSWPPSKNNETEQNQELAQQFSVNKS